MKKKRLKCILWFNVVTYLCAFFKAYTYTYIAIGKKTINFFGII